MIKNYSVALFWFIAGSVCWLICHFTYIYANSRLSIPVTDYAMKLCPSGLTYLLAGYIPYFPGFIITLLFASLLSWALGGKKMWLIAFIAWPVGYALYATMKYVGSFPVGLRAWYTSTGGIYLIASCFITPLIALLGTVVGNRWNTKRKLA
ncbi:MAG: hypothetical protein EPN25_15350 [Nitrospirae bacterium]|nr:MAG: hypothetical protein EPN25_15350 [Nitrospirota bacterium]